MFIYKILHNLRLWSEEKISESDEFDNVTLHDINFPFKPITATPPSLPQPTSISLQPTPPSTWSCWEKGG